MSMAQDSGLLPVGTSLGEYQIKAVLGKGGFGITYRAWDSTLSCEVAIKEFFPKGLVTRGKNGLGIVAVGGEEQELFDHGLTRFIDEAKTLAKFQHPSIVPVKRLLQANHTAYMIMAFVEGDTLKDIYRLSRGQLQPALLIKWTQEILAGLELIHSKQLLHRDIKPDNIYIKADGHAMLLDFGSARQTSSRVSAMTGFVAPGYSPPEQYSHTSKNQGPWSDIYALSASLYYFVTGAKPPTAGDRRSCLDNDEEDPITVLGTSRFPLFPDEFLQAINKGLILGYRERLQSPSAFLKVLIGDSPNLANEDGITDHHSQRTVATIRASKPSGPSANGARTIQVRKKSGLAKPRQNNDARQRSVPDSATRPARPEQHSQRIRKPVARHEPASGFQTKRVSKFPANREPTRYQGDAYQSGDHQRANYQGTVANHDYPTSGSHFSGLTYANRILGVLLVALLVALAGYYTNFSIGQTDQPPGLTTALLPNGDYRMGSDAMEKEQPIHSVTIRAFRITTTEITWAQFEPCIRANVCTEPEDEGWGRGNRPVINVSWEDVQVYIRWLNQQTGLEWRLPTEAEWEYAARARGSQAYGSVRTLDCASAWFAQGGGACGSNYGTATTASFAPNAWGLHDMHGNVWEWTQDCWHDNYSGAPSDGTARGSANCSVKVIRGGSWNRDASRATVSYRGRSDKSFAGSSNFGFRLVRAAD